MKMLCVEGAMLNLDGLLILKPGAEADADRYSAVFDMV
jgi:hypothetical protein